MMELLVGAFRLGEWSRLTSDFWDNFKHAVRMFRANLGFTFAAIAALALGIGINTAIFTVVDAVLLKPLTYPDADRMVEFLLTGPQGKAPIASLNGQRAVRACLLTSSSHNSVHLTLLPRR
jgi:hypothetical protein